MRKIAFRYGLWMLAGFIAFFLIMHLLNLTRRYDLRMLNGVIHLSLIYLAIRDYRHLHEASVSNHLSGVAMGMFTSAIGVVGFTFFMFFYLSLSPDFMQDLRQSVELRRFLTPLSASIYILAEGTAVSLIGSYILTRVIDMNLERRMRSSHSKSTE